MRDQTSLSPYETYIEKLYPNQNSVFDSITKRLKEHNRLGINIGIAEARFLQFLIKAFNPKKIIECGSLFGYSTVSMGLALAEDAKLYSIEKDEFCVEQTKLSIQEAKLQNKVQVLSGEVDQILESLASQGPFDMIFIDHNKSGYERALDWAEIHIKKNGLIIGDNTFLFGDVFEAEYSKEKLRSSQNQWKGMRRFNERLADPTKYQSIILPTGEGLSVALKL